MNREVHVRICESPRGKFPRATRPTLQVLGEEGRKNQTKSYMWVMRGRPPDHPIICYGYDPTRSASVAKKLLEGYGGIVQTDGYKGYDFLDKWDGVRHAGCWAHMRRYFATIVKTQKSRKGNKETLAEAAVRMIREIYALERQARADHCSFAEVRAMRQHLAKPKVEEFHDWLKDSEGKTPPKSLLGEAVNYALKQWPRLLVYLDDGALPMDTNLLENAIRPFVVGRKAWLFSGAPEGSQASAVLYSVLETAKANGWEPWAYFTHLFRHLPEAGDDPDRIRALLPIYPPETQKTDSAPQPPATSAPAK